MNLQDIVREQTRPISDLLKGTEKEIEDHLRNQVSAEARERELKREAGEMQPAISERERTLRDSQLKVQEIERQIAELQARLRERKKENERAETEHHASREESTQKLREAARARKEAEHWERKVAEGRERTTHHQRRLQEERRASLHKYLDGLWKDLVELEREATGGNEARAALERLTRARHDDARVAEMWEARQEWLRIAQSAGPPPVRETARREVQTIEADLEKQFPGALTAASTRSPDELMELYVFPREAGGYWLPLCLPAQVSGSLSAGDSGPSEALAARLLWCFARAIEIRQAEPWRSRFEVRDGYVAMILDSAHEESRDQPTLALPVAGGGRVTFILSELPAQIRGAVSDENTHR